MITVHFELRFKKPLTQPAFPRSGRSEPLGSYFKSRVGLVLLECIVYLCDHMFTSACIMHVLHTDVNGRNCELQQQRGLTSATCSSDRGGICLLVPGEGERTVLIDGHQIL